MCGRWNQGFFGIVRSRTQKGDTTIGLEMAGAVQKEEKESVSNVVRLEADFDTLWREYWLGRTRIDAGITHEAE